MADAGRAVAIATHDVSAVARVATIGIVLDTGQRVAQGPMPDVLSAEVCGDVSAWIAARYPSPTDGPFSCSRARRRYRVSVRNRSRDPPSLVAVLLVAAAGIADAQPEVARIVSTSPSTTEVLFALGLGNRVVGVSVYCRYPAAAEALPKVGNSLRPNTEVVGGFARTS